MNKGGCETALKLQNVSYMLNCTFFIVVIVFVKFYRYNFTLVFDTLRGISLISLYLLKNIVHFIRLIVLDLYISSIKKD